MLLFFVTFHIAIFDRCQRALSTVALSHEGDILIMTLGHVSSPSNERRSLAVITEFFLSDAAVQKFSAHVANWYSVMESAANVDLDDSEPCPWPNLRTMLQYKGETENSMKFSCLLWSPKRVFRRFQIHRPIFGSTSR